MLFCLPYSGAGGSAFRELERALPPAIEVAAVRLPGREQRFAEPPELHLEDIAAAITARADRPFAIFGHSLGARLGFEVIRLLQRRGGPLPLRLYVAAARPPDAVNPIASAVAELDDMGLVEVLIERIDAPSELRDNPEFRDLMLPMLRSDLGWLHRNAYWPGPPIEVPIVGLAGAADSVCGGAEMLGWGRHTVSFTLHTVPGGHFFPQTATGQVASLLTADLLAGARP